MRVLVINCGSSSLRFQLIDPESGETFIAGIVERIGAVSAIATARGPDGASRRLALAAADHRAALGFVLDYLRGEDGDGAGWLAGIGAVGHRVVHGGERFTGSVLIDEPVIEGIREAFDLAPLHNPANLQGIEAARRLLPDAPQVAVFDTAFHHTLPEAAFLYGVPHRLYRRHRIRRYGFHGTSHRYVSQRLFALSGMAREGSRVISCHLGNGASVTAIRDGRSVDTSMGLTPLSGLVMGTRCGDIDPSVIFYLMEKEELSLHEVHSLLNRHSGLEGLSGYASEMRALLDEAAAGDARCLTAIEVFCYRVRSYIGQYFAVLDGCDGLIFTGGIGEHSAEVRARICANLGALGIDIDPVANSGSGERRISTAGAAVEAWVIPTREELVIARDAARIAGAPG